MGGRRARSTAEVLGPSRHPDLVRKLQRALDSKEPAKIAQIAHLTTDLAGKAVSEQQLDQHLVHLLPLVQELEKRSRGDPNLQLDKRKEVRQAWARIERDRGISVKPIQRDALVQAVLNYLDRRGI